MVEFTLLDENHLFELEEWFLHHSDKWLGHGGYPKELLALQGSSSNRHCYVASTDGEPVAIIDLEVEGDGTAWISLVVRPDARGKGMGQKVLQSFLHHSILKELKELNIEIENDNAASIRCFEKVGFLKSHRPETTEGYVFFSRKV